eukprot:scaffold77973_cov80-Phaeocystis_antarctica.AAC.1
MAEVGGILAADGSNPSGVGVAVTRNGSMEKVIFPEWARHFVGQLGEGVWSAHGEGKKAVLLYFDGHVSRWSYEARRTPHAARRAPHAARRTPHAARRAPLPATRYAARHCDPTLDAPRRQAAWAAARVIVRTPPRRHAA